MTDAEQREYRNWFRELGCEDRRYIWEQAEEEYGHLWRPEFLRSLRKRILAIVIIFVALIAWNIHIMRVNREREQDSFTIQYLEGRAKQNSQLALELQDARRKYAAWLADQKAEMIDAQR